MEPVKGGFVELDTHKLDRDELVMLGMKEAMDKWVQELSFQAMATEHPGVRAVLSEVVNRMASARDDISVHLTKSAFRHKTGRFNELKGRTDGRHDANG